MGHYSFLVIYNFFICVLNTHNTNSQFSIADFDTDMKNKKHLHDIMQVFVFLHTPYNLLKNTNKCTHNEGYMLNYYNISHSYQIHGKKFCLKRS